MYMYEIKQNITQNNEAKGIFPELVQNDGNNKSFKMLPELVPSGCMPVHWGYIQFEIVKKCKISLPALHQVSSEHDLVPPIRHVRKHHFGISDPFG